MLSGFTLTWSARPTTTPGTFWWRRAARILPAHLVALGLAIPVCYAAAPDGSQWWVHPYSWAILLSVPLLQAWSNNAEILYAGNPVTWTLSCEAFFYAMHPAILRGMRRLTTRGVLRLALAVVAIALTYRFACFLAPDEWWAYAMPKPITRITEFVVGMCLALAMRHGWRPRRVSIWYAPMGLFVALLVCLSIANPPSGPLRLANEMVIELATVACAALIVAVTVHESEGRLAWLRHRVLVRLGEVSFAFYLVHCTVIYAVLARTGPHAPSWTGLVWMAALFVPALALAFALQRWVERPAEARLRRWWDDRSRKKLSVYPSSPRGAR